MATGYWLLMAGVAAAMASVPRSTRLLRIGLILSALFALVAAVERGRWLIAAAVALAMLANLLHLLVSFLADRRVILREEEARMADRALAGMSRQSARSLIDQGLWIDGREGEVLIREGQPVSHLFWLSEGEARVASGGRDVAKVAPDHFLGEITVLSGAPATATVALACRSRFWCADAGDLRTFLAANPGFRPALESAFAGAVAEKLRQANERLAAG